MDLPRATYSIYDLSFETVTIGCRGDYVTSLSFGRKQCDHNEAPSSLSNRVAEELEQYFSGSRRVFDVPILLEGTDFQKKVWRALMDIPYGETRSYGEIARAIGNPKASRAVGRANNSNPIGIIVPCHRVIGADGSLVGYAGGLDLKKRLLELEKRNVKE